MENIYTSGAYLDQTQTWHAEDSPWKAERINGILRKNDLQPGTIGEIGCGVGIVLDELSKKSNLQRCSFYGLDISPQAIGIAQQIDNQKVEFRCEDLLATTNEDHFDLLLVIDVFEHVPDYMGFISKCRQKAEYQIYHIPLDLHVSSVMRNGFIGGRRSLGHLHYFTAESALETLKDTGYEILDYQYTCAAIDLFKEHPSFRKAVANVPRWLLSRFSEALAARYFGGYSLLVLTR